MAGRERNVARRGKDHKQQKRTQRKLHTDIFAIDLNEIVKFIRVLSPASGQTTLTVYVPVGTPSVSMKCP